jgi:hypothetical protein
VQLPDGSQAHFPDGMSDDDIRQAMRKLPAGIAAKDPNELSWGDVPMTALSNVPSSAKRAVGELVDAVVNYDDTAEALGNLAVGTGQKAWRNITGGEEKGDKEWAADAVGQYFADRYLSMDGLKRALAYDPVGVLSDLSTVLTGGAGALKGAGALTKSVAGVNRTALDVANALKKTGQVGSALATYSDPLSLTGKVLGKGTELAMGKEYTPAQRMYQSALGLNTGFSNNGKARFSQPEVLAMTREGVDSRIPVTSSGWKQADDMVRGLNEQIDKAIDAADAAGVKVDPEQIAKGALWSDARADIRQSVTPERDLRSFDNAVGEYLDYHGADNTVRGAQESKKATYRQNEARYRNNAAPVASGRVEAQMELARQQRNAINEAVEKARGRGQIGKAEGGMIHNLNRREGNLIEIRDAIERAMLKSGNRSPIDAITAGAGAVATGDIAQGLALGGLKQWALSPGMKSRYAFMLDNLSKYGTPFQNQRPALATLNATGSQPDIQKWYRQKYGKGLLDLLSEEDKKKK